MSGYGADLHKACIVFVLLISLAKSAEVPLPSKTVAEPPFVEFNTVPSEVKALTEKLDNPDAGAQIQAALALAALGERAAPSTPVLLRRLRSDIVETGDTASAREPSTPSGAAVHALVSIGPAAVPYLHRALSHSDPVMRHNACVALGGLKHGSSASALMAATRDKNEKVRASAVAALGALRDPRSIPLLKSLSTEDESAVVRIASDKAHQNLTVIPFLINGLRDSSEYVRSNAAYILWLTTTREFREDVTLWEAWWREQAGESQ